MSYWITDYITKPSVEEKILGKALSKEKSTEAKVLLVWHQKVNEEYLDQFPKLIGIVRYGVGYDNIDLKAIKKRNIFFCNNPDYGVDEVSDTTVAMIMNLVRGIHSYNSIAKGLKEEWQQQTLKTIKRTSNYSVGVIGAGRIGSSVLLKLNSLKFKTGFYDPYVYSGYEKILNAKRFSNLNTLLKNSDIVSASPFKLKAYLVVFFELKYGKFKKFPVSSSDFSSTCFGKTSALPYPKKALIEVNLSLIN